MFCAIAQCNEQLLAALSFFRLLPCSSNFPSRFAADAQSTAISILASPTGRILERTASLRSCLAGGRYLADIWMYNLNKLAWTAPSPGEVEAAQPSGQEGSPLLAVSGPPPAAGWSVTPLQDNKLLVMGGHTKAGKVRAGRAAWPCSAAQTGCAMCGAQLPWQRTGSRCLFGLRCPEWLHLAVSTTRTAGCSIMFTKAEGRRPCSVAEQIQIVQSVNMLAVLCNTLLCPAAEEE